MRVDWLWFLIGIAFAMFVIPLLTGLFTKSRVSTTKSRGA
jgi:hypothetical protein